MKGGEQGAGKRVVTVLVLCPLPRGARAAGRAEAGAAAAVGLEVELRDVERGLLPRRRLVRLVAGPLPGQADPLAAGGGRAVSNGALGAKTPLAEVRPRCQPALLPLFSSPRSCRASERKGHGKAEARSRGGAKEKTLECGQIVWGLAFSAWPAAGGPDAAAGLSCLVLATGLNDGQIKVWEVQTGEHQGCGSNEFRLLSLPLLPFPCSPAPSFPKYFPRVSGSCCLLLHGTGADRADMAAPRRTPSLQPPGAPGRRQGPELRSQWKPHPGVGVAGQDLACLGPQQRW